MKRFFVAALLLLLLLSPRALARQLPVAASPDADQGHRRQQSYVVSEDSGEWSAHGRLAAQFLRTLEQGDAAGFMSGGVCALIPGVRGNRDLSLVEPVLTVCLLKTSPIEVGALSIVTGGVRYDFVGKAEKRKIGSYAAEQLVLPLGEAGLEMLCDIARSGAEVRVYGEKRAFKTSIRPADQYKTAKQRVEAMAIAAARDALEEGVDGYALWDLNEAHWEKDRPEMAVTPLVEAADAEGLPALDPGTQCLDAARRADIKQYQQMLKDNAFFAAKPTGTFGSATREATLQAQKYHGLLPTGWPDRALLLRLSGAAAEGIAPPEAAAPIEPLDQDTEGEAGVFYKIDGALSIRMDRVWLARAAAPSRAADALGWIWPSDRSNRLYVADGELVNLSGQPMLASAQLKGEVRTADGATYLCAVQLERDEGQAFGAELLPMGRARLVLTAEIPRDVSLDACQLFLSVEAEAGNVLELSFSA